MPKRESHLINTYGLDPIANNQISYDCAAFAARLPFERTGMTRAQLYRRISDHFTPEFHEWHEWTERMIESACKYRWTGYAGCSSSSKTRNISGFAVNWWMAAPMVSGVIICSTTIKAMRRRIWQEVQSAYQKLPPPRYGNFVDSKMIWQNTRGDDKHAIMGIAVEDGSKEKIADNIKGFHPDRLLVIIDEATAVPDAIMDAATNLWAYPREFCLFMLANPRNRLDQFGKFIEPLNGWSSVDVDTEEWETVPKCDGQTGICVRFDAHKSPNITSGRIVSRHLPTSAKVKAASEKAGSENDPAYWSNNRGFPPPEGIEMTVFSESLLLQGHAFDTGTIFTGPTIMIAGFDPSFSQGGDRAPFSPARVGPTRDGFIIQFLPIELVNLNANTGQKPITYQLSEGEQLLAEKHKVKPSNIVNDATMAGGGVCDVADREWARGQLGRVQSQERASEKPVSYEDTRPGSEVYHNKIAEMWFQAKEFVQASMVRGLDRESAAELCARIYEPGSNLRKIKLEAKKDMKLRIGKSPDLADARILTLEAARRLGIEIKPQGYTAEHVEDFTKEVEKAEDAWTKDEFSPSNEEEPEEEFSYAAEED